MTRLPQRNNQQFQQPMVVRPRRKKPKWRFRWEILWIMLAIVFGTWLLSGIEPAATWEDIMDDALNVRDTDRYSRLAILGVLACGICAIVRVLRPKKDE